MELDLGPEIAQFRAELRDWIAAEAPQGLADLIDWNMPLTAGGRRGARLAAAAAHPAYAEWEAKLAEARMICPQWPEEFGGQGMDAVRGAVLNEEFYRAGVPRVTRGMGEWLVGPSVMVHGTPEQRAYFLPRIISGEDVYCQGFSEPDHGSDLAAVETRGVVEADEIVGYHLEQAHRYRTDLGAPADPALAAVARSRLTAAGQKAQLRSDYGAAASLYERAAALAPPHEIDFALEIELGESLELAGRGADAVRRADALALRASLAGDRIGELFGRLTAGLWRINLEPEGAAEELAVLVEQARPVFEAAGNDLALYVLHFARGEVAHNRGHLDIALKAMEQAARHALRAGLPRRLIGWLAAFRTWGTTPVSELLAWLDENEPPDQRNYFLRAHRAEALARLGRSDAARAILAEARSDLADRGAARQLASITGIMSVEVELLADNPTLAAELGEEGCRLFEELGDKGRLSTAAGYLAQALYRLDRLDEADAWAARAPQLGASDDAITQILWRQVRAKVLARRGEHAAAEQLAREVAALSEETDMLDAQGDVYADLAEVLTLGGKPEEAIAALEMALARFERKENRASAKRMQERLSQVQDAPAR